MDIGHETSTNTIINVVDSNNKPHHSRNQHSIDVSRVELRTTPLYDENRNNVPQLHLSGRQSTIQKAELLHLQDKVLDHKMHLEESENENRWKSCCITMDKRAVTFFAQYIMLAITLVFSCIKLSGAIDTNDKQLYTSLITLIIGIVIPSPKLTP